MAETNEEKIAKVAARLDPELVAAAKAAHDDAECLSKTMIEKYKGKEIFWSQARADKYKNIHDTGSGQITTDDKKALVEADTKWHATGDALQNDAKRVAASLGYSDALTQYQTLSEAAALQATGISDPQACTVASNTPHSGKAAAYASVLKGGHPTTSNRAAPNQERGAAVTGAKSASFFGRPKTQPIA